MFWRKKPQSVKYKSLPDFERKTQSLMCEKEKEFNQMIESIEEKIDAFLRLVNLNNADMKKHIRLHADTFEGQIATTAFENSLLSQQETNARLSKERLCFALKNKISAIKNIRDKINELATTNKGDL